MHCLVSTFIKDMPEESSPSSKRKLYPIKILLPPNKSRIFYFASAKEQAQWVSQIKSSIGYSNLFDYYDLEDTLGKGQFGLVKLASHKRTKK